MFLLPIHVFTSEYNVTDFANRLLFTGVPWYTSIKALNQLLYFNIIFFFFVTSEILYNNHESMFFRVAEKKYAVSRYVFVFINMKIIYYIFKGFYKL